jgi:HD-GYP domain-containing protein (c-di-GMP phosphodiesterase class II)
MLGAISRALEERDQMQGHGARVAALAAPLAERFGWDAERTASLRFGAPLHDVGKVAVRPHVLAKPGALTLAELEEVRRHPRAGAWLVLSEKGHREALPFVLFHHERWDGLGYPTGMRGRSIPLEARVLAVADAFDAMTSTRPYRKALSTEHALAEVEACAGTQFDPEVAAAFLDIWARRADLWPAALAG